MGYQALTAARKRLTQELQSTSDPETLIRLGNTLAKLKPKRRRKPVEAPQAGQPFKRPLAGNGLDWLDDCDWAIHRMMAAIHKLEQTLPMFAKWRSMSTSERAAIGYAALSTLTAEESFDLDAAVMNTFSPAERLFIEQQADACRPSELIAPIEQATARKKQ